MCVSHDPNFIFLWFSLFFFMCLCVFCAMPVKVCSSIIKQCRNENNTTKQKVNREMKRDKCDSYHISSRSPTSKTERTQQRSNWKFIPHKWRSCHEDDHTQQYYIVILLALSDCFMFCKWEMWNINPIDVRGTHEKKNTTTIHTIKYPPTMPSIVNMTCIYKIRFSTKHF